MKAHWLVFIFLVILIAGLVFAACGDDDDNADLRDSDDDNDDSIHPDDDDDDDNNDDNDDNDDDDDDWRDPSTGLIWQKDDDCCYTWPEAADYCDARNAGSFDDWRLPTISELRSLIRGCDGTQTGGSCGVTDECPSLDCWSEVCNGCDYLCGPGLEGRYWPAALTGIGYWYWSSTAVTDGEADGAWLANYSNGIINLEYDILTDYYDVRCVRLPVKRSTVPPTK